MAADQIPREHRVETIEEEIRRSYREVELAVRQATLLLDHEGVVVGAHKLGPLVGRHDDELIGAGPVPDGWRLVDADGEPADLGDHPAERARQTRRKVTAVVGLVDPDGLTWPLRITAHPVEHDDEVAVDASIEAADRRPRARQRVEAAERRFAAMAELLPVAVYEATVTGEIVFINAAFTRLTGYRSAAEVPDLPMLEIVHPDDVSLVLDAAARAPEERSYQARYRVRHLDGSERWVTSRMSVLVDDVGTAAGFVGAIEDVDDLHRAEQQARARQAELAHHARHDPLTGLANRGALDERLAAAGAGSAGPVLAFYVDVDRFKAINDRYGHRAGDAVLVEVARRLSGVLRDDDLLVRMGGDEFVGWCAAPRRQEDVKGLADRLVGAVSEAPVRVGDHAIDVTVSAGVAVAGTDAVAALLGRADRALYAAKRSGRDRWKIDGEDD